MWLPLRMRGATAAALRVLPPKARGTGEFRTAVSAHAVRHCAVRRCTISAALWRCTIALAPARAVHLQLVQNGEGTTVYKYAQRPQTS